MLQFINMLSDNIKHIIRHIEISLNVCTHLPSFNIFIAQYYSAGRIFKYILICAIIQHEHLLLIEFKTYMLTGMLQQIRMQLPMLISLYPSKYYSTHCTNFSLFKTAPEAD